MPVRICRDLVHPDKPPKSYKFRVPYNLGGSDILTARDTADDLVNVKTMVAHTHNNGQEVEQLINHMSILGMITVDVQLELHRSTLSNIEIQVKIQHGQPFIAFRRQDITLQYAVRGSVPLNWIATVPLDFKKKSLYLYCHQ